MSIRNFNIHQMVDELANQTTERDRAGRLATRCHHKETTLLNELQRLRTMADQVAQAQQAAHIKTKAAVENFSRLKGVVVQLKQDIQIAKKQLQVHYTILYNIHAAVLDECPLSKVEILAKMEEEKVHDPKSMDAFISLLIVGGYLVDIPVTDPTGSNPLTTVHEQEGETKEQVVRNGDGTAVSTSSGATCTTTTTTTNTTTTRPHMEIPWTPHPPVD